LPIVLLLDLVMQEQRASAAILFSLTLAVRALRVSWAPILGQVGISAAADKS